MLNYVMNKCEELLDEISLNNFRLNEVNEFGFIMRKNSFALEINGITAVGMTIAQFPFFKTTKYYPVIIIDQNFIDMKPLEKEFFIHHELGHWFKQKDKILSGDGTRRIEDEYEADEYAAEQIGYERAIEALKSTIETMGELELEAGIDELQKRVENLMNKITVKC